MTRSLKLFFSSVIPDAEPGASLTLSTKSSEESKYFDKWSRLSIQIVPIRCFKHTLSKNLSSYWLNLINIDKKSGQFRHQVPVFLFVGILGWMHWI